MLSWFLTSGLAALSALSSVASGAQLTSVPNFGNNPSSIQMSIYVPDKLATNPAIVLALHYCGGSGQAYYQMTRLPQYADRLGFILIYPSTTHQMNCWDCHSTKSLSRDAGGDSQGLVSMVNYTINRYSADRSKVFTLGTSSGAMMSNVLAGTYPDVFAAGASFSGVPYACWAGSPASNPSSSDLSCPYGRKIKSAQEWGNLVRSAYPSYTGPRTRMQIWHGTTDNLVYYVNLAEQLKQWSDVLGVTFSRNVTNTPLPNYTQMIYGDGTKLVGYSASGVGHVVPMQEEPVLKFFGLM